MARVWLNDRVGAQSADCVIAGAQFRFFPVMPGILVDPATAILTPTQKRILDHLNARAPETVSGFELRDEIAPDTSEVNMRVQINRMRCAGVDIQSRPGVGGGYRVEAAA